MIRDDHPVQSQGPCFGDTEGNRTLLGLIDSQVQDHYAPVPYYSGAGGEISTLIFILTRDVR